MNHVPSDRVTIRTQHHPGIPHAKMYMSSGHLYLDVLQPRQTLVASPLFLSSRMNYLGNGIIISQLNMLSLSPSKS